MRRILLITLLVLLFVAACQSEPPTPPPMPADPSDEIIQKCMAGLTDNNLEAFRKDSQQLGDKPSPRDYGSLLRRYYTCDEAEAFSIWWLSGAHTGERLDMTASWGEFSAGWEGK